VPSRGTKQGRRLASALINGDPVSGAKLPVFLAWTSEFSDEISIFIILKKILRAVSVCDIQVAIWRHSRLGRNPSHLFGVNLIGQRRRYVCHDLSVQRSRDHLSAIALDTEIFGITFVDYEQSESPIQPEWPG